MSKNKLGKIETEEQAEIKKFILVLGGLIVILVGIYFFTRAFVTKDLFNKKKSDEINYQVGVISDTNIIVGNLLNRPYEEYYALAFSSKSNLVGYYDTIMSKYKSEKESLKIYYIDTEDYLNNKYIDKENPSTSFESLDKLKLGEITLMKIKKGKITKLITNVEEVKKELNIKASE